MVNAHKRLAAHLRMGPSPWYPAKEASPLMYYVDENGVITSSQASQSASTLANARAAAGVITYAVAETLGGLFLLLGIGMLVYAGMHKPAPKSVDAAAAPPAEAPAPV